MKDLTARQKQILDLYLNTDLTQKEIGTKLGITQSAVHKHIWGNIDHKSKKVYGGIFSKLAKHKNSNPEYELLLNKM